MALYTYLCFSASLAHPSLPSTRSNPMYQIHHFAVVRIPVVACPRIIVHTCKSKSVLYHICTATSHFSATCFFFHRNSVSATINHASYITCLFFFSSSHSSLHNFQLDRTTHISPRARIGGRQPFIIIWASSDLATVPYRRTIPQYCNCAFHFPFPFPVFTALLQISQHSFIPSTLYRIVHFITACHLLPPASFFFLPRPFSIRYSHSMPTASKVCMGCDMGTFDLFFFSASFY